MLLGLKRKKIWELQRKRKLRSENNSKLRFKRKRGWNKRNNVWKRCWISIRGVRLKKKKNKRLKNTSKMGFRRKRSNRRRRLNNQHRPNSSSQNSSQDSPTRRVLRECPRESGWGISRKGISRRMRSIGGKDEERNMKQNLKTFGINMKKN